MIKLINSIDHGWAQAMHSLQNGFFNGFFKYFSYLADKGVIIFIAALLFMLFKSTRKKSVAVFAGVLIALILSFVAKYLIARPRPFADISSDYYLWWTAAGGADASKTGSCPSGHSAVAFALATVMLLSLDKRYGWTGIVFAALIVVARTYLMVHYLTDTLVGMVFGMVGGVAGYFATELIFKEMEKRADKKPFAFILGFDLKEKFKK